ncbi:MAG: DUF421 domain-containing protein [Clostridia bacterium]|nr:DUF421 domain-containing protein [Clostridia bacterium]
MEIGKVIFNSVISFFFLFIIAKIMGKKQIAQLDFIDYIIGISLGSIAAQMSFDTEIPFYYFLIAMAVFALLEIGVSLIGRKSMFLKNVIIGKPVILVEDGKLLYKNIKKTKLTINEFLSLCREKDYFNINDIAYCIFETSGKISVLPKSGATPVVAENLDIKLPEATLSSDLILDGKVVDAALEDLNKSIDWLYDKLNIRDEQQISEIALATYDENKNVFYVHPKNQPEV